MKITEVTRRQQLRESIVRHNTTGFLTEDLVRVAEMEESGCWSEPQTADELIAEMDSWDAEYDTSNSISPR